MLAVFIADAMLGRNLASQKVHGAALASVSHLPSNIAHQMLDQKYIFGADKAA